MTKLSKNIIFNLIGQTTLILVALFSVKYIYQQLGAEVLGIIYFIATLNAVILSSLNKGVSSSAIQEIATSFNKDQTYIHQFVQTFSVICWSAYFLFGIIIYFLAPLLVDNWINLSSIDRVTAIWMIRILGIAALLALPKSLYTSILIGLQRMEFTNLINVSGSILQRLGIIIILINGTNLIQVIYWMTFCYILEVVAGFAISSQLLSYRALVPRYSPSVVKKNIRFGLQLVSISLTAIIQKQTDRISLSKLLPIGSLGYYSFAYNNVSKGLMISQSISQAAYPHLCDKFNNTSHKTFVKEYRKLQDLVCFLNVPVFVVIPFLAVPLFTYIFNAEMAEALRWPVTLLSLGFYMNGTMSIPYRIVLAAGKPDIEVRRTLFALFIVPPLTLLFVYFWGLTGAAMGLVFNFLFAYLYSIPKIFNKCLATSPVIFFKHLIKIFILTGMTYGIAMKILSYFEYQTFIPFLLAYFLASGVFFGGAYLLICDELKKIIHLYARNIVHLIYSKACCHEN
ncbi:MAG: lipopolysaccharide biosynthesis protein [Candidatus Hodarchaeales archaeon]|jgi:O-antigen/teichoic acid export membrane protein